MTTAEIVSSLREAFPDTDIKKRPDGYSYIDQEKIMARLMDCTGGVFDIAMTEGPKLLTYPKLKTGESVPVWVVCITLTIPGLGSRSNVGTATALNEDSPKSAVTDGIKKAATLFGVAMQLYEKDTAPQQTQSPNRRLGNAVVATRKAPDQGGNGWPPVNDSGAQCTYCRAPDGKQHLKTCPTLQQAA